MIATTVQKFGMRLAPAVNADEYLRLTVVFLDEQGSFADLEVQAALLIRDPAYPPDRYSAAVMELSLQKLDHPEVAFTLELTEEIISFALDAEYFVHKKATE